MIRRMSDRIHSVKNALVHSCKWLAVAALTSSVAIGAAAPLPGPTDARSEAAAKYGQIPLAFEANQGQTDAQVRFLAHGEGYGLFLTSDAAIIQLQAQADRSVTPTAIRMQFLGANRAASILGAERQPGVANYFIGNDPRKWHTGVPTYGKVNYGEIFPGIDLVFYGNQRQLEYDFVIKPGADPAHIAWSIEGASPHLDKDGSMELDTTAAPVRLLKPMAYQMIDGKRQSVASAYAIAGTNVRLTLGEYDHSRALVIDPILSYFSYLGGTGADFIGNANPGNVGSAGPEPTQAVGIDSLGDLYVGGSTTSTDFPVASPLLPKTTKTNTSETWAFVSKFSPDGSELLYSTYLGGSTGGNDAVYALAVDASGNLYATGTAGTNDFPVTAGAFQTLCAPHRDNNTGNAVATCTFNTGSGNYSQNAFALKLNPTGSSLLYSSFLGGYGAAWGTGIAVDSAGQAYITGAETATLCGGDVYQYGAQYECFPTTAKAVISDIGGGNSIDMAFMSVFNATGSGLVYSTLYGDAQGSISVNGAGCTSDCGAITRGTSIALDPSENIYIGGFTITSHLLVTAGAFNTTGTGPNPGNPNAVSASGGIGYVAKFSALTSSGTSLVYSTYFGGGQGVGGGGDVGGLAADASGNAYITGETHAPDFPATTGAWQTTCDPNQPSTFCNQDGYVAKLNPTGTAIVWATYLGNGSNAPLYFLGPIAVDSAQNVYVEGQGIGQLPLGGGTVSTLNSSPYVYVAKFDSTGSQVLFGAAVAGPGNGSEHAGGMAVDPKTSAIFIGGSMGSGGSYTGTSGAFQTAFAGGASDGFVAKVLSLDPSTTTLSLSPTTTSVGQKVTLTAKVSGPQGSTVIPTGNVTFASGSTTLGSGTLDSTGTATYSTSSLSATTYTITAEYGGDSNFSTSTSSTQTLVVNPISTTTTLTASATTATSGTSITFTATVSPASGSVVPTGTVTFIDGTTTLGTGALDSTGKGTYTTSTLGVGTHSITAAYAGDQGDLQSTSSAVSIVISPVSVSTSTTLTATATMVTSGTSITFTATVSPASGSVVPTGSVTFKDGTTTVGTGNLDSTGKTTATTSTLSVGSHSITAVYAGDAKNSTSTSAALAVTVNALPAADFSLSMTPTSGSVTGGAPAAIMVSVTPLNGFNAATTFACSGLPANSNCTFSPASVTPSGTAASTTTLTINSNVTAALSGAVTVFSLLLLPIAGWRNRTKRKLLSISIPLLVIASVAIGICACGGSSKTSSTITPKGNYSITVTATSGSLSHSASYSFTVN